MLLLNKEAMGENRKVRDRPVMSRHAPVYLFVSLVSVSKAEAYNMYAVLVVDHPVKAGDKQAAAPLPATAWPRICIWGF